MPKFLKTASVYAFHVPSHDLIKVGYGEDARFRMVSYCRTYGITAAHGSLRVWTFPAWSIAAALEAAAHEALLDAGFSRYLMSNNDKEAQELFFLGGHFYEQAVIVVAEAVQLTARSLADGLKSIQPISNENARQRKEQIRLQKEKAKLAEEQKEYARRLQVQAAVDAVAKNEWNTYIKPWVDLCGRAQAITGKKTLSTTLGGLLFRRDCVDILRSRDEYPKIIMLIKEIFHAARKARKWRLDLSIKFGREFHPTGKNMQFPGGHFLHDEYQGDSVGERAETEVRLAVQTATGWGGDEALNLMRRDPRVFIPLVDFAGNNPSP
jgi:hypothetical protein